MRRSPGCPASREAATGATRTKPWRIVSTKPGASDTLNPSSIPAVQGQPGVSESIPGESG